MNKKTTKNIIFAAGILILCSFWMFRFNAQKRPQYSSERNREYFEAIQNIPESGVAAILVNGEKITVGEIQTEILFQEYSIETYREQCEQRAEKPNSQIIEKMSLTEQEIKDKLIRSAVLRQTAKNLGISATLEEGKRLAQDNLKLLKESAQNGNEDAIATLNLVTDQLVSQGKTLSDFVEVMAEEYQTLKSIHNVQKYYESTTEDETLDYEAYVQKLISQADVQYLR